MSSYTEYKKRVLQNPKIKAEYDAFEPYSKYSPFEKREEISNTTTFNARTNSDIKQQCAPFDICIEQTNKWYDYGNVRSRAHCSYPIN